MINEAVENLNMDEVLDLIKDFPIIPYRNRIIVTTNTLTPNFEEGANFSDARFDESQYVLAVGSHISEFKAGDKVILDLEKMSTKMPSETNSEDKIKMLFLDFVEVGDRKFVLTNDSFVRAIDRR